MDPNLTCHIPPNSCLVRMSHEQAQLQDEIITHSSMFRLQSVLPQICRRIYVSLFSRLVKCCVWCVQTREPFVLHIEVNTG